MYTGPQTSSAPYVVFVSTNVQDLYGNTLTLAYSSAAFNGYGSEVGPVAAYTALPYEGTTGDGRITIPLSISDIEQKKCRVNVYFSTTSATGPWTKAQILISTAATMILGEVPQLTIQEPFR